MKKNKAGFKKRYGKDAEAVMYATATKNAMKDDEANESGILYRAGVKKYGKAGMKAIQSAAGKGASHQEIGKIKDKHLKDDEAMEEDLTKLDELLSLDPHPNKCKQSPNRFANMKKVPRT